MKFLFLLSVALSLGLYRPSPQKKIEEVVLKIDFCKYADRYDYCYSTIYSNNFKDTNYYLPAGKINMHIITCIFMQNENKLIEFEKHVSDSLSNGNMYYFFKSFFTSNKDEDETNTIKNPTENDNYLFRNHTSDKISLIVCVKGKAFLFEDKTLYNYKNLVNFWTPCSRMAMPEQMQERTKTITTAKKIYPPSPRIIKKLGLVKFEQNSFIAKNCYYPFR